MALTIDRATGDLATDHSIYAAGGFNGGSAGFFSLVVEDTLSVGSKITGGSIRLFNGTTTVGHVLTVTNADGTATWQAPSGGGGGLDQATADGRYVNITGDTLTGPLIATNASQLITPFVINRTATSTSTSDADTFVVNYLAERATWTNEKGNLRTSNKGAKGEVAMKIIGASTAEGGTGNMMEVLDIAGNMQTRIGPLGRQNFNKGIRMVGDTIQVRDSTEVDTATISQALGGPLLDRTQDQPVVNSKKITSLADGALASDAVNKGQMDLMLPKAGGTMTGALTINATTDVTMLKLTNSARNNATPMIDIGGSTTAQALNDNWLSVGVTGEAFHRLRWYFDGAIGWGPGSSSRDTWLYRWATNTLKTDGSLIITANAKVNSAAGVIADLEFDSANSKRWNFGKDATAESGSNAGSNFAISRWSDAGAYLDSPIAIARSTGAVTVAAGLNAADIGANTVSAYTAPTIAAHVTRKDYVDARTPVIVKSTTAPTDLTAVWIDIN